MNNLEKVFNEAEQPYKRGMLHATFGHLAPKAGAIYTGYIVFAHGCHGDIVIIDYNFIDSNKDRLGCSPWLFDDINEYIGNAIGTAMCNRKSTGRVYRFNGTYARTPDIQEDGSARTYEGVGTFKGRVRQIKLPTK